MSKCTVGKRGQSVGRRGNHFREQGFKGIQGTADTTAGIQVKGQRSGIQGASDFAA